MAEYKITDLTELASGSVAGGDLFAIVDLDADVTKKVSVDSLRAEILKVGSAIASATANRVLLSDGSSQLGESAGITYSNGLFLEAQAGTHVPLKIKAHTSQSVNPFQVLNGSDAVKAYIDWGGFFSGGGTIVTSYSKAPAIRTSSIKDFNNTYEVIGIANGSADATFGGAIKPATIADASAANNSIYYSSDASKLVYKDSGGTVNNLY